MVIAVFFNTGMPSSLGVIEAVFNPENWEFVAAYTVVAVRLRHWCLPLRWFPFP